MMPQILGIINPSAKRKRERNVVNLLAAIAREIAKCFSHRPDVYPSEAISGVTSTLGDVERNHA